MQDFLCLKPGSGVSGTLPTAGSTQSSPAMPKAVPGPESVDIVVELPDENRITVTLPETCRTPDLLDVRRSNELL